MPVHRPPAALALQLGPEAMEGMKKAFAGGAAGGDDDDDEDGVPDLVENFEEASKA